MSIAKREVSHASASPRRVCMLAYTFYENDARVMRYAEALREAGAEVDVISLMRDEQPMVETVNGVNVVRIQRRRKDERGKYAYLWRIVQFFVRSMIEVTRRHQRAPYDIVHVHSVPDFEVFAALVPKLRGAKVILDIHDIVPEFYASKFHVEATSMVFRALTLVERLSVSFADHVIVSNEIWKKRIALRTRSESKCSALINYPDDVLFNPGLRSRTDDGRFLYVYPGTLSWHQGLDLAIRAFALVAASVPSVEFHIYGEGSTKSELQQLVAELCLSDRVTFTSPLPLRQIAGVMANADVGVVPKRNDEFGGDAFSTKVMEFMAVGVPVIVSDTRVDRHYFDESIVSFFKAGDVGDLADVMANLFVDRRRRVALAANAFSFVRENSWTRRSRDYLDLLERLVRADA